MGNALASRVGSRGWATFAASFFVLVAMTAVAQTPPPVPLIKEGVTVKVSDHVWVIPDGLVPVVPNVGIIVGSRATLIVDTGLGIRNGEAVLREVAKVSKNAEVYVATTHFHAEHTTGVAFGVEDLEAVDLLRRAGELDRRAGDLPDR